MNAKQRFGSLIAAQNNVRRVWADEETQSLDGMLRAIDKDLTKIINEFGRIYANEFKQGEEE